MEANEEVKRPVEMSLTIYRPFIPPIAKGHEDIYLRFLKGILIYRPNEGSDEGMISLPIADLTNPLDGKFDLSQCGDTAKYLTISTGYRKEKKKENASKIEIWIAPRFLIHKEINDSAKHFQAIFPESWKESSPVGLIWTWGGWANQFMDYLTNTNMFNSPCINLQECWGQMRQCRTGPRLWCTLARGDLTSCSGYELVFDD